MAEDDDPRCNAATDRIAHRLEEIVAPAQASPATPVLTEDTVFEVIFADEEPANALSALSAPDAQMDLYNQEELEDWPAGPAEDYLASLLSLGTASQSVARPMRLLSSS